MNEAIPSGVTIEFREKLGQIPGQSITFPDGEGANGGLNLFDRGHAGSLHTRTDRSSIGSVRSRWREKREGWLFVSGPTEG